MKEREESKKTESDCVIKQLAQRSLNQDLVAVDYQNDIVKTLKVADKEFSVYYQPQ